MIGPDACLVCGTPEPAGEVVRRTNGHGQEALFCEPCWPAYLQRKADDRKAQRTSDLERWEKNCLLGDGWTKVNVPCWPWARFDNPQFRARTSKAIVGAAEAYRDLREGLVLQGPTGSGKTAALVAWMHAIDARARGAIDDDKDPPTLPVAKFITGPQLVAARRNQKLGAGEADEVRVAMTTSVLLLDEVGFESMWDTVIFEVADARYGQQLPTILTTGRTAKEFAERYGAACWRRFSETATVVADFPKRVIQ